MPAQITLDRSTVRAKMALERPFSGVAAQMFLEVSITGAPLVT